MTGVAKFTASQRVGILVGVQSVNGPHVRNLGTVVKVNHLWADQIDYTVRDDADGSELVYPAYLLVAS